MHQNNSGAENDAMLLTYVIFYIKKNIYIIQYIRGALVYIFYFCW